MLGNLHMHLLSCVMLIVDQILSLQIMKQKEGSDYFSVDSDDQEWVNWPHIDSYGDHITT